MNKHFLLTLLLISALYTHAKDITFTNSTNHPVKLNIIPGRSSKLSLGTKAFEFSVPARDTKTVTVYSKQFGGKGDYISEIKVAWDKEGSTFEYPFKNLLELNTFIQSKDSAKPITIKSIESYRRSPSGQYEATGESSITLKLPEGSDFKALLHQEKLKTEQQARKAGKVLENLGRKWLGLQSKR